ncbi:MAG: primosomal protein N' [Limnochordaceae bacterium]|nr:primosomal protein N' [Limnochordaceae bacterium]
MPSVLVVDLREELAATGRVSPLSRPLHEALKRTLEQREQAILFVNRRGFSGAMACRECGYSWRCPHCDVSLTYHHTAAGGRLRCHYCGYETAMASICPRCGSRQVAPVGFGTQKVQAALAEAFPGVPVLRLDADTTTRRRSHERILEEFANSRPAVLVGTQMVAKGHDFPGVTLAAAVLADVTLHLPDFRAAERTLQQLVQVSGRAGRGERPGTVVIQTFQPHHHSIQAAALGDLRGFYAEELAFRRRLSYPPFGQLIRMVASDPDEARAREWATELARRLEEASRGRGVKVLGPAPAPIARIRDRYRWQVVVRGPDGEVRQLAGAVTQTLGGRGRRRPEAFTVDVDPVSVL